MSDLMLRQWALRTASVNGLFTLEGLCKAMNLPADDIVRRDMVWRVLAPVSDEKVTESGTYCWQLGPDARRAALRQFYALPQLKTFLKETLLRETSKLGDPFSIALAELLRDSRISFEDPGVYAETKALQRAIQRAAGILDAVQFAQEVPALQGHLYQVRVSASDTYVKMSIADLARFADAQIKDLQQRSDLQIVAPEKHFGYSSEREMISKFARGKGAREPLLLTGIGGSGKSALLSRLMLGWQRSTSDMAQVLLDFDRRQLAWGEPIEILREFFRQIMAFLQRQRVDRKRGDDLLRVELQALRSDIELFKTDQGGKRASNSFQMSYALRLMAQLQEDWAKSLVQMPIVLVLDTFEAIDRMAVYHRQFTEFEPDTYRGNEVVSQIMQLLQTLQQNYLPNLRVIVSGREEPLSDAELNEWFGPRVRLDGLSSISGAKLLQAEATRLNAATGEIFTNDDKARQVSRLLGGHPLALIAFAKYADSNLGDVDDLIAELEAEGGFAAEFAQVFLYTRILNRISDPSVRPLAHPGLMLRRIDPQIILHVLSGPCLDRGADSPNPLTPAEADTLFERLRNQYWLVDPVQGSETEVRHIPELRRLMLPGLLAGPRTSDTGADRARKEDLKTRAHAVCAAAAAYFTARGQGTDDLDALYYGAFADDPPEDLTKTKAQNLDRHLGEDVATLPVTWRAVIRHLLELDLSDSEAAALPARFAEDASQRAMSKVQQTGTRIFSKNMAAQREMEMAAPTEGSVPESRETDETPRAPKGKRPSSRSLRQQGFNFQAAWNEAHPTTREIAESFLDACVNAATKIGSEKEITFIDELIRENPLGNPLYLSVLLQFTKSAPSTLRFASAQSLPSDASPMLGPLFEAVFASGSLDFRSGRDALLKYAGTLIGHSSVTANRCFADQIIRGLIGKETPRKKESSLFLSGMSLAAGNYDLFKDGVLGPRRSDTKGMPSFQRPLAPLWEEYRADDISLATLERFYRLDEPFQIGPQDFDMASDADRRHLMTMIRGLNPELYPPTIALLSSLDFHAGESVVLETAHDLALWPIDLQFDDQQIYSATDASAVVETADRCGALRVLMQNLAPHAPFATRLISIYDFITDAYFSETKAFLGPPVVRA